MSKFFDQWLLALKLANIFFFLYKNSVSNTKELLEVCMCGRGVYKT